MGLLTFNTDPTCLVVICKKMDGNKTDMGCPFGRHAAIWLFHYKTACLGYPTDTKQLESILIKLNQECELSVMQISVFNKCGAN